MKRSISKIFTKESLDFFKHSVNYISAEFFIKALSFISIPIFTRIFSPEEYGILAIFHSLVMFFSIIIGFNFWNSITRYYHEKNNDFKEFFGSITIFSTANILITILFLMFFKEPISLFFNVSSEVFVYSIIISGMTFYYMSYLCYLQASKQSNIYSRISIVQSVIGLVLSIVLVFILLEKRYMAIIYSRMIILTILLIYCVIYIYKNSIFIVRKEHVNYALRYSIPILPHALSGFILSFFDRMMINKMVGSYETGLYSFAYNIGMLMQVVVIGMNSSWTPIFFQKLNEEKEEDIKGLIRNYSNFIYIAALALIIFSVDIVKIASNKYHNATNLIPVIIMSFVFVFLYNIYSSYSFYRKRTFIVSIITLLSGFLNVVLNYLLIPKFGYAVAAYTTLASYFVLFLLHFSVVKIVLKEKKSVPIMIVIHKLPILIVAILGFYFINQNIDSFIYSFLARLCLLFTITVIILYEDILEFRKKIKG